MKNYIIFIFFVLLIPIDCLAGNSADQCYENLVAMPELAPIANKMSFPDIKKASFEQISNTDLVTDQEKPIIAKYANESIVCFDIDMSLQPSNIHLRAKKALIDNQNNKMSLLVDLYNNKISYGKFIQGRKEASELLDSEFGAVDQEIVEYNSRQNDIEETQKHRAWANFFNGLSDSIKPKPSLNCNPNGLGGVRCQQ